MTTRYGGTRARPGDWAADMFLDSATPIPINTTKVDESTIDLSS
jgi:hypothetical protein